MKKAFTLIELLVVIAIIAILAALLMPALSKAREEAEKTKCRTNIHNVGLSLATMLVDTDGVYPGWVTDTVKDMRFYTDWSSTILSVPEAQPTDGDPYYQLIVHGYLDDIDLFDCPTAENPKTADWSGPELIAADRVDPDGWTWPPINPRSGVAYPEVGWWNMGHKLVRFVEYSYDMGRISRNSVAGRVIYGDSWERAFTWGPPGSWGYWPYNHPGGSNTLMVDQAVQFAPIQDKSFTFAVNLGWTNWNRAGVVPNPRMDEDVHMAEDYGLEEVSALYPADHDDIYLIDGGESAPWWNDGILTNGFCWGGIGGSPRDPWHIGNNWNTDFIVSDDWGGDYAEEFNGSGFTRAYHWWNSGNRGHFPEVGRFANEASWDRRDSCLIQISGLAIGGGYTDPTAWSNW
jgi:prepilin-type N-terminal cleavage/methylation domain-containing protein